jgi:hypothetical protein
LDVLTTTARPPCDVMIAPMRILSIAARALPAASVADASLLTAPPVLNRAPMSGVMGHDAGAVIGVLSRPSRAGLYGPGSP